jgi:hypothetical protein
MRQTLLIVWLGGWGIVVLGVLCLWAYLYWKSLKMERAPLFPIHEWMAFAASLDPPLRDQACEMIQRRRFSWGWRQAFLDWHRRRVRLGLPMKYEDVPHEPIPLQGRPGVYVLAGFGCYKIGYSNDVRSRVANMNTATPIDLVPVFAFWTEKPQELERELHQKFDQRRIRREWFQLNRSDLEELACLQARYAEYSVMPLDKQR